MSSGTVVVALLILVVAAAIWAVTPPQVGTLAASVVAVLAVLYVGVSLA